MKGGEKLDLLNVLSTGSLIANVSSSSSSSSQTADNVNFANQLVQVVNAGQAQATTSVEDEQSSLVTQLISSMKLLSGNELTTDELNQAIEGLLDQLDSLKEFDLSDEQLSGLEQVLGQLAALLQAVSIQFDQFIDSGDNFKLTEQLSLHNMQQASTSNNVITKLQDQLLMLQQALQEGNLKVVQGKQPENLIAEQLQQVKQAIDKLLNEQPQENKNAQSVNHPFIEVKKENDALTHLQKLAEQYNAITTKQSQAEIPVQSEEQSSQQPLNAVTLLRADNVKDFLPQLAKASSGTTSAFVLATEFADTMKGLIVQKFDVTALNNVTEARLMLTPENLGHVDVRISMHNGVLTAMFQAETAMGKDAIENQMAALRASLAAQGITVEKIEVSQASFAAQLSQQQKQNQQQHLQDGNQQSSRDGEDSFEEEMLANVSHRELGYGRAVNAVV